MASHVEHELLFIILKPEVEPEVERVYSVIVDFQIKREWS